MIQVQQICVCGRRYWPNQAWQHNDCASNNTRVADPDKNLTVVNSDVVMVVNRRTKDRHKDKEVRKVYLREYMRKKRANEKA